MERSHVPFIHVPPSDNFLQNYGKISQPEYQHIYRQYVERFHHLEDPSCCPFYCHIHFPLALSRFIIACNR